MLIQSQHGEKYSDEVRNWQRASELSWSRLNQGQRLEREHRKERKRSIF